MLVDALSRLSDDNMGANMGGMGQYYLPFRFVL